MSARIEKDRVVHREPITDWSDLGFKGSVERGEAAVRRTIQAWPYNHDLYHQVGEDLEFLEFFFIARHDGP